MSHDPPEPQQRLRARIAGVITTPRAGAARPWGTGPARIALAAGISAAAGLVLGVVMPRGPVTSVQALTVIAVGVGVGLAAGLAMRSRWAMLIAPVAFALGYELARIGHTGPTVDRIRFGSTYGLIAFVSGRAIDGLLMLVPMLLGAALGAAAFRRRRGRGVAAGDDEPRRRRVGRQARTGATVIMALGIVTLVVFLALPASTNPIRGADGRVLPGSIAELARVPVGGHDQVVMLRGHSVDNPVILFLAGGPGGTEIGSMRNLGARLEERFVVATWEQRGAGKSVAALEPVSTLTLDQMVRDALEVTDYLRDRFDEQKVYVVGNSWGTILGALAAKRAPERFHAFVGAGQMVSPHETDRIFYEDTLAWAERTGRAGLVETLRANGPPPYDEVWKYEPALSHEREWNDYPTVEGFEDKGEMPGNLLVKEYSLIEKVRAMGAFLDTFSVLYPQLDEVDLRTDVASLGVPVFLVQGRYEARGRADLAREWLARLRAPVKQLVVFERSGHKPLFEEPERFRRLMTDVVLAKSAPP